MLPAGALYGTECTRIKSGGFRHTASFVRLEFSLFVFLLVSCKNKCVKLAIAITPASGEKSVGKQKNKHTEILPCRKKSLRSCPCFSKRKLFKNVRTTVNCQPECYCTCRAVMSIVRDNNFKKIFRVGFLHTGRYTQAGRKFCKLIWRQHKISALI